MKPCEDEQPGCIETVVCAPWRTMVHFLGWSLHFLPRSQGTRPMSPLRSREVKALSEAVEHIYQETDLDQFPHRVFDVIGRMLPGVFIVSQEFNTRTRDARSLSNRAAPVGLIERCAEIIPVEHPIFHAILGGARGALRLSDFWTARQLRRTSVYHEIFKPIEVQHEIVIPLILPNHVA